MSKGITIAEHCHVVCALAPVDIGGVAKVSDYFSLENYAHATIIVACGAVTNAATITVEESTTNAGAATTPIAYKYAQETTAAGDTPGALAWATAAGISTGTNNGTILIIEIDASQLTDGYPYLVVKASAAAANLISVVAILSGSRYAQATTPTAIT